MNRTFQEEARAEAKTTNQVGESSAKTELAWKGEAPRKHTDA